MCSRSRDGSRVWNGHLLHLNLMSSFDARGITLDCFVPNNSPWTFWTWSRISAGRSELKLHLLHLKFPRVIPIVSRFLVAGVNLWNLFPPRTTFVTWQAANLWDWNCFWLKVEKPQSSQRRAWPSPWIECLLFFWNRPWALLICSRKEVFQVEL